MNAPEFSVVIPTFRRPGLLREATLSALMQDNVDVEIIVVDDSQEGSAQAVISEINDTRVKYFKNQAPTGGVPSVVRNLGLEYTAGRFIHFLDDDDVVPRGHYQRVRTIFESHPDIGLVYGVISPFGDCPPSQLEHERRYFEAAAIASTNCQRYGPRWGFTSRMLFGKPLLVSSAGICRRECVVKIGGFDPEIRLLEDTDFYIRLMRNFGAHFSENVALNYRIGYPSLMHAAEPTPDQIAIQYEGRKIMRRNYRKEYGLSEYYALSILGRGFLRR
jgi:glycosyltransferase involved in cell wall biosynthesis